MYWNEIKSENKVIKNIIGLVIHYNEIKSLNSVPRLDKIFFHDFSMTISRCSMTISLPDFEFATFCGKASENADFLDRGLIS